MSIKVWSIKDQKCINTLSGHSKVVTCLQVVFGLMNNYLISGSEDKTIKVIINNSNCSAKNVFQMKY